MDYRKQLSWPEWEEAISMLLAFHGIKDVSEERLMDLYNQGLRVDEASREIREVYE